MIKIHKVQAGILWLYWVDLNLSNVYRRHFWA